MLNLISFRNELGLAKVNWLHRRKNRIILPGNEVIPIGWGVENKETIILITEMLITYNI